MSGVTLKDTVKKYGHVEVIHGVSLTVEPGEFCVFVGPSGCGKSTLLRMIAGLEETTSGKIFIGKHDVTGVDPAARGIAMVFQSYALYPHMTVAENMGFGLRMNKVPKDKIKRKVEEVAAILHLEPFMDRKPKALSGGQRQRTAIGRALVRGPEVFLFDEPLSNLDAELRVEMRIEIARLHQEIGATMIYVTHDQIEAMTLADKIVVLRDGLVEQCGTPLSLYENPDNQFVAGFIGSPSMNFFSGSSRSGKGSSVSLPDHTLSVPDRYSGDITIGLRPEHINIDTKGTGLKVDMIENLGGVTYVHSFSEKREKIVIETKGQSGLQRGDEIGITFTPDNMVYFDPENGLRIR